MGASPLFLRGTGQGLEFVFGAGSFSDSLAQLREHLAERPRFYQNTDAHAVIECPAPDDRNFADMLAIFAAHGISLRGIYGDPLLADLAASRNVPYLGEAPPPKLIEVKAKPPRPDITPLLSDGARSLVADFAGARVDLASRRTARRGAGVRNTIATAANSIAGPASAGAAPAPAPAGDTLYHRGTVRGGQSLHHLGNIVVMGDVNPGAELVATGDIAVFGSLRGVAHAGAQGDANARVVALEFAPTQLRIATLIAVEGTGDGRTDRKRGAEEAHIADGGIAVAPFRAFAPLGKSE